jgi:hypothetical protein
MKQNHLSNDRDPPLKLTPDPHKIPVAQQTTTSEQRRSRAPSRPRNVADRPRAATLRHAGVSQLTVPLANTYASGSPPSPRRSSRSSARRSRTRSRRNRRTPSRDPAANSPPQTSKSPRIANVQVVSHTTKDDNTTTIESPSPRPRALKHRGSRPGGLILADGLLKVSDVTADGATTSVYDSASANFGQLIESPSIGIEPKNEGNSRSSNYSADQALADRHFAPVESQPLRTQALSLDLQGRGFRGRKSSPRSSRGRNTSTHEGQDSRSEQIPQNSAESGGDAHSRPRTYVASIGSDGMSIGKFMKRIPLTYIQWPRHGYTQT